MAYSNAEKQERHRQRLQEQGLVQVQGWVTSAQAEAIPWLMAERGRSGIIPNRNEEPCFYG